MSQQGSIRKRGKTWTCYWFVHDPDGRRRQRSKGGFRTRAEATEHRTKVMGSLQAGTYVPASKSTLGQFLNDEWFPAIRDTLRPTTLRSYRGMVETHVLPRIGGVRLTALTPAMLNGLYADMAEAGRVDGKGPLSDRTRRYLHTILRRALRDAVRWGKLARNVADLADPPKPKRAEMQAWSGEEAGEFLDAVRGDRLYPLWLLLLARGLRRGEALGLRWEDVDLEAGRIAIRQTLVVVDYELVFSQPKTEKGRRTIPLDADLLATLRAHRKVQLEERLAWASGYVESGLVFTREDGSPIHPQRLSRIFQRERARAGLRRIRFHDLRHTAATLSLRAGIPTKIVSEWLGHSTTSITEDLYRHVTPSMLEEAGAKLTAILLDGRRTPLAANDER